MANRPAPITQAELTRCAKAMQAAGVSEWRVVVRRDGSYEIVAGKGWQADLGPDPDELLE